MSTPGSIAVITREEMDVRRAQSIRDLLRYAPGIYFSNDTDFRFQKVSARGFAVETYLDGLRLQGGPFGAPRIDPYLLERAEVITGPASILYGAASPGGILNLVSKRPTEKPFGEVSVQGGSFDRIQGTFDVGGPVDKDKTLLYRVTGIGLSANTQVDNIGEQRFSIAPAWTWRPNIDTTITFLTSYRQDPKGGAFALLPIQGTLVPGTYGQIPRNFFGGDLNYESLKYKQATLGYEFEHRFDDVFTVRQNVRYLHNELNYVEVQPSGFTTTGAGPTLRLVDGRTIRRNYLLDQREPQHVCRRQPAPGQVQHGPAAAHRARRIRLPAVRLQQSRPLRRHQHARHPGAELHPEHRGPDGGVPESGPAPATTRRLCPGRGQARAAHRARRRPLRSGRGQHAEPRQPAS